MDGVETVAEMRRKNAIRRKLRSVSRLLDKVNTEYDCNEDKVIIRFVFLLFIYNAIDLVVLR